MKLEPSRAAPIESVKRGRVSPMDEFASGIGMTPTESAAARAAEGVRAASQTVSDAIDAGRRPGMPLDTLARLTRESPLAALAIAFLLGLAISRPRYQPVRRRLS